MFRGLGSLLLGAIVGAGAAMLFAPETGAKTREQLRSKANALKDQYLDQYGDIIEKGRIRATELVSSGRDLVEDQLAKSQDLVNTAVETARTGLDQVKEQIPQLVSQANKPSDESKETKEKAHEKQF